MISDLIKAKLKASGIHLGISVFIFFGVLYLILVEWYPGALFEAQGGWSGIKLMAAVDLVLGPSLTLIVFNHLKKRKEIILDLSLIAIVQLLALVWGGHSVYSQRPVALVFYESAFYTVTNDDYAVQGISRPDFSEYSSHIPPLIFSRQASNMFELEQSRQLTEQSIPAYAQVALYEKIDKKLDLIFSSQVNIEEVRLNNAEMKMQLDEIVQDDVTAYKYVVLKAKYQNMILVMDASGHIVGEVKALYL